MVAGDRTQVAPGIYKQDGVRGVRYHAFYRDEEGRKRSWATRSRPVVRAV